MYGCVSTGDGSSSKGAWKTAILAAFIERARDYHVRIELVPNELHVKRPH